MKRLYLLVVLSLLILYPIQSQAAQKPTGYGKISFSENYENVKRFFLDKRMKLYPVFGQDINVAFYIIDDYIPELDKLVSVQFFFTSQERKLYKIVVYIDHLKNEEVKVEFQKVADLLKAKYGDPKDISSSANNAQWYWEDSELKVYYAPFKDRLNIEYIDLNLKKENSITKENILNMKNKQRKEYLKEYNKL